MIATASPAETRAVTAALAARRRARDVSGDPARRIAEELGRRGLAAPARLLLDAHLPIAPLLADAGAAIGPLLRAVGGSTVDDVSRAARRRIRLQRLIEELDERRGAPCRVRLSCSVASSASSVRSSVHRRSDSRSAPRSSCSASSSSCSSSWRGRSRRWVTSDAAGLAGVGRAMALAAESGTDAVVSLGGGGITRATDALGRLQTWPPCPSSATWPVPRPAAGSRCGCSRTTRSPA